MALILLFSLIIKNGIAMFSKRLTRIDKQGNIDPVITYVHSKENLKNEVKWSHSKGYIVVIEDAPLPNRYDFTSKGYRL